jgi:outer membrane protein OmpA-like peptidoglycan-associated protein/uncharacterized surface protein with fasciclin (FAS1) repeats
MTTPSRSASRYQRRILAWGGGVAALLFVVGAPVYLDRVETDLAGRVTDELTAAGYEAFTVSFSGQTGSISCSRPLGDPSGAVEIANAVRGVRSIDDLPDACRVLTGEEPGSLETTTTAPSSGFLPSTSTTTTTPPVDFGTVVAVLSGNPRFSLLSQLVVDAGLVETLSGEGPFTLFAPTDEAFDAVPADLLAQLRSDDDLLARVLAHHVVAVRLLVDDLGAGALSTLADDELTITMNAGDPMIDGASITEPDDLALNGVVHAIDTLLLPGDVDLSATEEPASASATYADGVFVLRGVVRSEVERGVLVDAAVAALGEVFVTDELVTDAVVGLDPTTAGSLASLIAVLPDALVTGVVGFDGTSLFATGTYADEAGREAMSTAAAAVDADLELSERPAATDDDAETLEAELNAFVSANPIRFAPSSAVLDAAAVPILDEIARRALEFGGVAITVEGHTDSDGIERENLVLSRLRALAVRDALIERGLDPGSVAAQGFGSSEPVLVDGVEDKDASRRVEFRVVAA